MENIKKIYKLSHSITKLDRSILKDIIKIGGSYGNIESLKKDIMDYITHINNNLSRIKELEKQMPDIPNISNISNMSIILEYYNFNPFLLYKLLELLLLKINKIKYSLMYTLPQNICDFKIDDKFNLECFKRMYKAYIFDCDIPYKSISTIDSDIFLSNLLKNETYLLFCPEKLLVVLISIVESFKYFSDNGTTLNEPLLTLDDKTYELRLLDNLKTLDNSDNNPNTLFINNILRQLTSRHERDGNYLKLKIEFKTNLMAYLFKYQDEKHKEHIEEDYISELRKIYRYLYLFMRVPAIGRKPFIDAQLLTNNTDNKLDDISNLKDKLDNIHDAADEKKMTAYALKLTDYRDKLLDINKKLQVEEQKIHVEKKKLKVEKKKVQGDAHIQKKIDKIQADIDKIQAERQTIIAGISKITELKQYTSGSVKFNYANALIITPAEDFYTTGSGQHVRNLLLIKFFIMLKQLDLFCQLCLFKDSSIPTPNIKYNTSFITSNLFTYWYDMFKTSFTKAYNDLKSIDFDRRKIFGQTFINDKKKHNYIFANIITSTRPRLQDDTTDINKVQKFNIEFKKLSSIIPTGSTLQSDLFDLIDNAFLSKILLLYKRLCELKTIYRYTSLKGTEINGLEEKLKEISELQNSENYKKSCKFFINIDIEKEIKDPINAHITDFIKYCELEIQKIKNTQLQDSVLQELKKKSHFWGCIFIIYNNKAESTESTELYEVLPLNNYRPIPQITELTLEKLNNAIKLFLSIPNDTELQNFLEKEIHTILIYSFAEKEKRISEAGVQIDEDIDFAAYSINTLLNTLYKEYNKYTDEGLKKKICLYIEIISSYVAYKFKSKIIDSDGNLIKDNIGNELIKDIIYLEILNIFGILNYFKNKLN